MSTTDDTDLDKLLKECAGAKVKIQSDTRLVEDLGIYGDDLEDFLLDYSKKFDVDMTSYIWYFHTAEEPSLNLGALFFATPDKRVKRISITTEMLREFIILKKWNVDYPEHSIPSKRYDITITWIFLVIYLLSFLAYRIF